MEDVGEEGLEINLPRRQALDETHGRAAARARPRARRLRGRWLGRWSARRGQGLTTLWKLRRPTARGEETEVADADEALGEDVEKEAAEKLLGLERERAHPAAVSVVLPPKRDGVVGHVDQPVV